MKKAISFSALLVLALLCGLWASRASAQAVFGSILGTVTDPQGAAVAGAKVTITEKTREPCKRQPPTIAETIPSPT